jgi:hypothetical protein
MVPELGLDPGLPLWVELDEPTGRAGAETRLVNLSAATGTPSPARAI